MRVLNTFTFIFVFYFFKYFWLYCHKRIFCVTINLLKDVDYSIGILNEIVIYDIIFVSCKVCNSMQRKVFINEEFIRIVCSPVRCI